MSDTHLLLHVAAFVGRVVADVDNGLRGVVWRVEHVEVGAARRRCRGGELVYCRTFVSGFEV